MSDELNLPELQDTILDVDTIHALVRDLTTVASVQDVLLKGGVRVRTDGRAVPLAEAVDALIAGEVFGVQVRYRYQDKEWRDTLMRAPAGVRLVRMEMPELT